MCIFPMGQISGADRRKNVQDGTYNIVLLKLTILTATKHRAASLRQHVYLFDSRIGGSVNTRVCVVSAWVDRSHVICERPPGVMHCSDVISNRITCRSADMTFEVDLGLVLATWRLRNVTPRQLMISATSPDRTISRTASLGL